MDVIPEYLKMANAGMKAGYSSANAIQQSAEQATQKVASQSRKAEVANTVLSSVGTTAATVTGILGAAGAANAVPVAGQIASAGLAIAGLLTKIFTGRRQKKKAERKEQAARKYEQQKSEFDGSAQAAEGGAGIGLSSQGGPVGATAPVSPPQTPSYSGWSGARNPSVQPPQEY